MTNSVFVGVDGCPGGWFSVGLDADGGLAGYGVHETFTDLLTHHADACLVLVDIPIGLPHGPGGRDCDKAAIDKLKPLRHSSVFRTPTRLAALVAANSRCYKAAARAERSVAESGLSKQTFNIARKIAEVDGALVCRDRDAKPQVREVHPEVCFWALNGCKPMSLNKKVNDKGIGNALSGEGERIGLLTRQHYLPHAQDIYTGLVASYSRKHVAKDDILDALAAAVTGWLAAVGKGKLATLPAKPQYDALGLPMEMVYCVPDPR